MSTTAHAVALDPGKTTGWVSTTSIRVTEMRGGQIQPGEVWDLLTKLQPERVICESFKLRKIQRVDLTPVEVIGVVKEWCKQNNVPLTLQDPAAAKHFFTDERLKERMLYLRGAPHRNDAARHLLYALKSWG